MHERDLRRLALESGKTTSRKAKAKAGQHLSARSSTAASPRSSAHNSPAHSPRHSPNGSRAASRAGSRQASSDDDEFDSDGLASSIASLDIGHIEDFHHASSDIWHHELAECIDQIVERSRNKRNTAEAREEQLGIYANILKAQYAADEVQPKLDDLLPALLKCFRSGSSEREAVYALQALALTVITTGEEVFNEVDQPLKVRIQDSTSEKAQAMAIHTLGAATFFGGADASDTEDIMDYLLEIVKSDGESVDAVDSGAVVTAAMQEWGFLSTRFPDMAARSAEPLNDFEDQLDSSVLSVQLAAGSNIALLYEKSYTPRGGDSGDDDDDDDDSDNDDSDSAADHDHDDASDLSEREDDGFERGAFRRSRWTHRYNVCPSATADSALKSKLADLSRASARHIARDKRKDLHRAFADVLHAVEHPWRGPRFSTALSGDASHFLGHRLVLRDGKNIVIPINRWWLLFRYEAARRLLGQGFLVHLRANDMVSRALKGRLEVRDGF